MSRNYIPVPEPKPKPQPNIWFGVGIGAFVALLAALHVTTRSWNDPSQTFHLTAEGKISEARIVVDHITESSYGASIFYRVEAHVQYELDGQLQDRWLTASEITADRPQLVFRIAAQPKSCRVSWVPGHPENAKCRLE
jgi:hypothetical protein